MKKNKESKEKGKGTAKEEAKNENLGKYFLLGILVAAVIFIVMSLSEYKNKEKDNVSEKKAYEWSAEADSNFVKICYDKYRSQVKDDLQKQKNAKEYCSCMLGKMKSKYSEQEVEKMTDKEIKLWDTECRDLISNPNNLK